MVARRCR